MIYAIMKYVGHVFTRRCHAKHSSRARTTATPYVLPIATAETRGLVVSVQHQRTRGCSQTHAIVPAGEPLGMSNPSADFVE